MASVLLMKRVAALVLSVALLASCARSPETRLVSDAAGVLGGPDVIENVTTLVIEGDGESYYLGENRSPHAEFPVFSASFKRTYDWASARLRFEEIRTPQFLTGNPNPRQLIEALDGAVAFDVAPDGKATRRSDRVATERRALLHHHPIGILRAALASGAQLAGERSESGRDLVGITTAAGERLTMSVDAQTRLPVTVASAAYHPFLGDVTIETEFAEYRDVEGLKLPTRITSRIDGRAVALMRVKSHAINGLIGRLEAPAIIRSASPDPPAPVVKVEEIAPGTWFLTGGTHHSVLVELSDRLVLVETPLDEARALAVVAKAEELKPGKPLTHLIVTHHHFDHAGGVRAAVAKGLTLVVRAGDSLKFFEAIVRRPHTRVADILAKNPKPLKIESVGARYVLEDTVRPIEVYPIEKNPYADTLLMAYLPKERLLIEADVFSPVESLAYTWTRFSYPFASNLVENIQSSKLDVERIVPLHGQIVPLSDLLKVAGSQAPASASPAAASAR